MKSVRQNCYYNDMPIVIFAENCTDGTNDWLHNHGDELGIEYYIEDGIDSRRPTRYWWWYRFMCQ